MHIIIREVMTLNEQKMKLAVIGGDLRQLTLARLLASDGYEVALYGFDNCSTPCGDAVKCMYHTDALKKASVVILPVPYSKDKCKINAPFTKNELRIDELFESFDGSVTVFAGLADQALAERAKEKKINLIDYMKSEELNILNAVPCAEGAIELSLSAMLTTLHSSSALVIGYGRIGKVLSRMLDGMGAYVTVAARSSEAATWISVCGYEHIEIEETEKNIHRYDVIYNTVPHRIITPAMLKCVKEGVVIIDLASEPGGIDTEYAKSLGINAIHALSLPGKTAPVTSGKMIKECICRMMKKRGITE